MLSVFRLLSLFQCRRTRPDQTAVTGHIVTQHASRNGSLPRRIVPKMGGMRLDSTVRESTRNCVPEVFSGAGWKMEKTARSASPFQPTWSPRVVPLTDLPRLSTNHERPLRRDVHCSRRGHG